MAMLDERGGRPARKKKRPDPSTQEERGIASGRHGKPWSRTGAATANRLKVSRKTRTRTTLRIESEPRMRRRPSATCPSAISRQGASFSAGSHRSGNSAKYPAPAATRKKSTLAAKIRHLWGSSDSSSYSSSASASRPFVPPAAPQLEMSTTSMSRDQLLPPAGRTFDSRLMRPCWYHERSISGSSGPISEPSSSRTLYAGMPTSSERVGVLPPARYAETDGNHTAESRAGHSHA